MKKLSIFFSMLTLCFVFGSTAQASIITIDLIEVFDTNADNVLQFGDNSNRLLDNDSETVEKHFSLNQLPMISGEFTVYVDFYGDDSSASNYFSINGTPFSQLPNGNGDVTYTQDNAILNLGSNSIIFHIGFVSKYWGLDDFDITDFTLTYESTDELTSSPVPEPATMLLLGFGLIAVAGIGRKKQ